MRIVFFGTPEFAIPSLKKLFESAHEILGVVTAPDKPKGRGRSLSVTPVKKFALEHKLKTFTPQKLKDPEFERELKNLSPDLFVVVAFRILPENIFKIPTKGSFNLHGSLLPKYRGAAPIQWALIKGENETGLTTFFLQKKVDTGNIILREKIKIDAADNFGILHDKMSIAGSNLVVETVNQIENNSFEISQQDDSQATPAPKITRDTCRIDWNDSAVNIHNLIRGLSPFPGAFFFNQDKQFKIFDSKLSGLANLSPGEILTDNSKIFIGSSTHALQILELQPEGRRRMKAENFLRGYTLR